MFSAPDALLTNESAPSKTPRRTPGQDSKAAAPPARKSCNCRNSRCLKLYCECTACLGNIALPAIARAATTIQRMTTSASSPFSKHSSAIHRRFALKSAPGRPTLPGVTTRVATARNRGASRSTCECFQAGIACSDQCKCSDCRNRDPVRTAPTRPHSLNHPILLHPAHVLGPLCALFAGGHCCWSLTIAGGEAATTRRAGDRWCGRDATPTSHSKSACNSSVCRCSRQPCSSSATGCRCDEFAASARAKGYRRLHRR